MRYIKYFWYIVRHKWYVLLMCFRFKQYKRGILHDLSKFRLDEFLPYANFFYSDRESEKGEFDEIKFNIAWRKHYIRNDHHPEHHRLGRFHPALNWLARAKDMPTDTILEMLADWYGAGRAQGSYTSSLDDPLGEVRKWYKDNRDNLKIADHTRGLVEKLIAYEETENDN